MKWLKDKSETNYELKHNDEVLLKMHFDYAMKGTKATCQSISESFTIEQENIWTTNTIIKENEVIIARTSTDKWYSSLSTLEVKGQKIKFRIRNNPLAEIIFFTENEDDCILSCGLKVSKKSMTETVLSFGEALIQNPIKHYLLAICWYIFKPIAEDNASSDTLVILV